MVHQAVRVTSRPQRRRVAWVGFGVSVFLAGLLWVQLAWQPIRDFGNSDQWMETPRIISRSFLQAVFAGHNGVPTYIQNALNWLDYHWLDYRVGLPRVFVLLAWPLGTWSFFLLLRRSGLPARPHLSCRSGDPWSTRTSVL